MKKLYSELTHIPIWQQKYPIDCILNMLIAKTSLRGCIMYPNIVIADLTDSDLREARDMTEWSSTLRWNVVDYVLL